MERLTKPSENNAFYVTDKITGIIAEEGYYGEAIDRLAKFENLYAHLMERYSAIPSELEALRSAGKNRTVTFKERLTEKMIIEMLLNQLRRHGLE